MFPDSGDISLNLDLNVCIPACSEGRKLELFIPVRLSRNHYLGHLSLIFSGWWDTAPEEGEARDRAFIILKLSRTRDYHPHTEQARSFGAGITRPPVTALSLFPFPLLAHIGLPELLRCLPLSFPNPALPTSAHQTIHHPFA